MYWKKNFYMLFKRLLDLNSVKQERFLFFFFFFFVWDLFLCLTFQWDNYKDSFLCVFIILRVFQLHTYLYKDKLEIFTIENELFVSKKQFGRYMCSRRFRTDLIEKGRAKFLTQVKKYGPVPVKFWLFSEMYEDFCVTLY